MRRSRSRSSSGATCWVTCCVWASARRYACHSNCSRSRSTSVKTVLDELDRQVKQIAHEVITEGLMTLALPGEVLSLGRDVPGAFPADLKTIDNPDLRALLLRIDPTPDTTRGSGADDWSALSERSHFIADLFRVNEQRPSLLSDPFTPEQESVIKSGGLPAGRL